MRRGKTDAKQGARCKIAFEDRSARVCAEITLLSNDTPQFRCRLPDETVKCNFGSFKAVVDRNRHKGLESAQRKWSDVTSQSHKTGDLAAEKEAEASTLTRRGSRLKGSWAAAGNGSHSHSDTANPTPQKVIPMLLISKEMYR